MVTRTQIDQFLALRTLAVAGVSRSPQKFGHMVYRDLKQRGLTVYPVNPNAPAVDGDPCYPDLAALPAGVEGLVLVTKPAETEKLVRQAAERGIRRIWIQPGAESPAALEFCRAQGLEAVSGECVFMYREPGGGIHRVHRWVNALIGKGPK